MNIKLVAVDMDGTLLNSKKEMPEEFIPWVKSHPEIKTVIASGRQYYTLERDFLPIRDNLAFIAENGGFVFEKGEIIFKDEIDKQDMLKCLDIIDKVPYATPVICGAKSAYITKKDVDEEIYYNVEMYYERRQIVEDLRKVADNDTIVKVAIYFKKEKAEESMKYFENIGEKLTAVLSGASWIDIANKTESKGNAIKAICEKYGIAHTEAMGFGDYLNDISLLESCGESYCMKNGHPTLKALAKYLTENTNHENGVMEVLKTL